MKSISVILKKFSGVGFIILLIVILFSPPGFAVDKKITNSLGMEFVLIPHGTFIMGSPPTEAHRGRSEIQHKVTITRPFYMQATEVTVKQWRALMGKKIFDQHMGPDNMPVMRISWYDCEEFIKKLNLTGEGKYRLPTEAEWEYAARAGTLTAYFWGNAIDCTRAMYGNNSLKEGECIQSSRRMKLMMDCPAPVKNYPPNQWGLYDMHGNVWEWCMDWYGEYSKSHVTDPRGPDYGTMKVRRGGSWFKYGYSCRSANRTMGHPATRYRTTGFRLVREVQ